MLTDATSVFKAQIFNNYMKVKTINELASLLGYGVTTFRVKFKEQFGVSAYRWILNQKSKQIIYNMTVEGDGFAKSSMILTFLLTRISINSVKANMDIPRVNCVRG